MPHGRLREAQIPIIAIQALIALIPALLIINKEILLPLFALIALLIILALIALIPI